MNTSLVPIQAFFGSCKQLQTGAKFVTVITKKVVEIKRTVQNIHSPVQHLFDKYSLPLCLLLFGLTLQNINQNTMHTMSQISEWTEHN